MHEFIEDFMHYGELSTSQGAEGDLVSGLGVEDVAVVDMGFVGVHVVIAEDIFSTRKVGVVAEPEHANSTGRGTVQVAVLGDFQEESVSARDFAPQDYPVVPRPWDIKSLVG